ncbi:MAG TPA: asparagine synthase-related protein, partial [Gammaproteobacteria bacterium]|nr:asparagine synthase-related protein [Gammaproteobacteria bacterium]
THTGGRPAPFNAAPARGKAAHRARVSETVEMVCRRFSGHPARWILPLSGGVDSRALLFYLHDRPGLQTITWGVSGARNQEGNDAQIARSLADVFGIPNRYFPTDFSKEPRERLIRRFLTAGEGRVAQISGYLDGFAVWKTLFDEGFDGIVRGDEAFGTVFVHNAAAARFRTRVTLLSDYFDAGEIASFELPEQRVPAELERRAGETLSTYRDRLYQEFSIPAALAALTDLKAAYVEVANPLLAASVLDCVGDLPDELRTNKRLWRETVAAQLPEVPFASQMAVMAIEDFVTDRAVLTLMLDEMHGENAAAVFAPALRKGMCSALYAALKADTSPARPARVKLQLARMLPPGVAAAVRSWRSVRNPLNPLVFAFRAFLVLRMNELLELDAATAPASLRRAVHL